MTTPLTPNGWRVLNQSHSETYLSGGNFEEVMKVTVVSANGTHATFTFPVAQYNEPNVIAKINEWAERENRIAALGN